jgi:uncharacterized protein (TIGR02569 family)
MRERVVGASRQGAEFFLPCTSMSPHAPPATVLSEFGVTGPPRLIHGGQGTSWLAGGLVFKPEGGETYEWLAEALGDVALDEVRLAMPVRTLNGTWVAEGWSATRWVEGHEPDRPTTSTWIEIIEAGRALHRAVAHLPRPDCLDARQDWWALADKAAWGERPIQFHPELNGIARRLQATLEPLGRSQIVHADLTRNVLFAPAMVPAVIDISPYWRPPEYAEGVVVADALCWHGAQPSLLKLADVSMAAVARALLFRMATTNERVAAGVRAVDLPDETRRYITAATTLGL